MVCVKLYIALRMTSHVVLSGGGISGLCLAVLLCRDPNIQVDMYESASRFAEIGAVRLYVIWASAFADTPLGSDDMVTDMENLRIHWIGRRLFPYCTFSS